MRSPVSDHAREDAVRLLVEQILRTGLVLSDLLCTLIEDVPEDAFPGERPAEVLIEMLTGTVRPAAEAAGPETVLQARMLLGAFADRTLSDLQGALELARRR